MSSTPKSLIPAQDAPAALTALYTSPVNGKGTWIDKATAANHNAAAQSVSVNVVPSGGSAGAANVLVAAKSLAAGATDLLPELVGKFLAPGDSIHAQASSAASVSLAVNGRELT